MADELMQAGIFEGMTWWNSNPAKNFFPSGGFSPSPYCSIAAGVEGLASTWPISDHQIIINNNNNNIGVLGCTQGPPHDSPMLQSMDFDLSSWTNQDFIGGDYNSTTWGTTCESSPPITMNSAGNSSGNEGSTLTCDGQIPVVNSFPVDPTSMFSSTLINDDHEIILPPCDWNNGTTDQVLGSSFNQQQQQIINHIRATLLGGSPCSSSPSSPKAQSRKRTTNSKVNKSEDGCDSGSEPTFKRQRIETPSSLPTFKVRKEKLGDRITALQQLVSPFGKTDTASVLHEAIEYIKFLHDQVNALSTPYMKNGAPIQHHHQQQGNQNQKSKKSKGEIANQDLRSRGLCLVPISSTFPVAHESPADFWTPTFGGTTSFK